jgi:hypothetical protein
MMETLKSYLETIYRDNGLLPTVLTVLGFVSILVVLAYLGINPLAWLQ